jgi:hypothetical protein
MITVARKRRPPGMKKDMRAFAKTLPFLGDEDNFFEAIL